MVKPQRYDLAIHEIGGISMIHSNLMQAHYIAKLFVSFTQ